MAGEKNEMFWRGIRPTDPAENIPVDIKACSVTLPVGIASIAGNMPVDIKVHTVRTPVDIQVHTVNTPVDIKSHDVNTPIIPSTPPQNIPVDVKSMTGNMPVDIKAHTVNTPVDIKGHDVATPVKDTWVAQGSDTDSIVNPGDNDIIFDTGQLAVGYYDVFTYLTCTVNHYRFIWEHRNAANNADIDALQFLSGAYSRVSFPLQNIKVVGNERFRVRVDGAITGNVVGGIYWTQRA